MAASLNSLPCIPISPDLVDTEQSATARIALSCTQRGREDFHASATSCLIRYLSPLHPTQASSYKIRKRVDSRVLAFYPTAKEMITKFGCSWVSSDAIVLIPPSFSISLAECAIEQTEMQLILP